jgi:glycosyltransferase involved in cell wall biosynthesis
MTRWLGLFTRHVDRFVAPSVFTSRWLVERVGVPEDRVSTIPHVIDSPASPTDPGRGSYIAFAGRFVPEKGIHTLLQASRLCDVPVKLSRNAQHFVDVELPASVEVVVTRGRDDLAAFYRGARALVVPSLWFESYGIVGGEAMSHGVPVVASRLGALADLVVHGEDGLLFEPGDAADLSEALRRLWSDPGLCRRLGEAARLKALRIWSPAHHLALYRTAYARTLEDPALS